MEMHFATVWEAIADAVPDAPAIGRVAVAGVRTTSAPPGWRPRSPAPGWARGPRSAKYLYNSPEYLEGYFAAPSRGCSRSTSTTGTSTTSSSTC